MFPLNSKKSTLVFISIIVVIGSTLLAVFAYRAARTAQVQPTPTARVQLPTPTPTPGLTVTPTLDPTPTYPPVVSWPVFGVEANPTDSYPGIPWVRIAYPTCRQDNLRGAVLKSVIQSYHEHGIRVLLTTCQSLTISKLYDTAPLNDAAQGGADAVQCGNEEMKQVQGFTRFITPAEFAKYYDLCQHAMHAVRPDITVLVGSLDPHVGGVDYGPLNSQVDYLNQMQYAMNTSVHPGGHWSWRSQTLGMIATWHDGYPNQSVNSLYGLFTFWASQFNVDLNSGQLGKHIWVVEGTACALGCGINPYSPYQVAVSHILSIITDVMTTRRYKVPFFYFAGKDIPNPDGTIGPVGVYNVNGHPKPLRQDLPMGARTLNMSCPNGNVTVVNQEQLLAKLYAFCSPPGNYYAILTS